MSHWIPISIALSLTIYNVTPLSIYHLPRSFMINLIIVYELTWNCGRTYDETSSTRRHDKGWEFMKIGKEFEKI